MTLERLTADSCHKDRLFMERLIESSFPKEEYRDMDKMHALIDREARFHACLIKNGEEEMAGVANYWDFSSFIYLEHLVTREDLRGQGLGAETLKTLRSLHPRCPIILEAEMPKEEIQGRRIGFYQRCGFRAMDGKYFQPPYHDGDRPFEMVLLKAPGAVDPCSVDPSFAQIRKTLYKEAYQLSQEEIEALT